MKVNSLTESTAMCKFCGLFSVDGPTTVNMKVNVLTGSTAMFRFCVLFSVYSRWKIWINR
jgi:hypothetical protein